MNEPATPASSSPPSAASVPAQTPGSHVVTVERYQALRAEQNLPLGMAAGIVGALIGAIGWAVITVMTGYEIGYMAVAIGFLVGYGMRLGKGLDKIFGVMGAILALLGCVLGNLLSIVAVVAGQAHIGYFEALTRLDYSRVPEIMSAGFSAMDIVFYAIAVYEGYRFSFRRLTAADLAGPTTPPGSVR